MSQLDEIYQRGLILAADAELQAIHEAAALHCKGDPDRLQARVNNMVRLVAARRIELAMRSGG